MTGYLPACRVGLAVPSANPAFEPELRALLPAEVALHAARLPVMPGTTLAERNARYLPAYETALASFGDLALDAQAIGLTGPSYALPPAEDAALEARLSQQAGRPVVLPSRAIAAALDALGPVRRVILFSPYPGWLTDRAEAYWRAAGMEVAEVFKVSDTRSAYELTPEEVVAGLRRLRAVPADSAVILSGTGMATLDALAECGPGMRAALLPSNLAVGWALHRVLGLSASPTLRQLSPRLAASL